jgi:hypothetical protein
MVARLLKNALAGLGGTAVAIIATLIVEIAALMLTKSHQQQIGFHQSYRAVGWPMLAAAVFGFVLTFVWMWRRT